MRSFVFIFIVSSFSALHAEENIINGLLFNSIYDVYEGRNSATSLTIPSKDAVFYETNLTIDFDVFFGEKIPLALYLAQGMMKTLIYLYYHIQIIEVKILVL